MSDATPTAADFAAVRFATHPDGHVAMRCLVDRVGGDGVWFREYGGTCLDRDMPGLGYVPVPVDEIIAERDKIKRGARELGRQIEKMCTWVVRATQMQHVIDEDGDGDWELVWSRLAEITGVNIFDEDERTPDERS